MKIFDVAKKFIVNLVFPDKCIYCDDVIPFGYDKWVCPDCAEAAQVDKNGITEPVYLYVYDGLVREMLLRFKYNNYPEYAVKLGELLSEKLILEEISDFDVIVPVPMHEKKKKKRGYNQAELLAVEMGRALNKSVNANSLIRHKNTLAQSLVQFQSRRENIRGAFMIINPDEIKGKNIILVDDIYTSGSTMQECAEQLKNAGANKIYKAVVALARNKEQL